MYQCFAASCHFWLHIKLIDFSISERCQSLLQNHLGHWSVQEALEYRVQNGKEVDVGLIDGIIDKNATTKAVQEENTDFQEYSQSEPAQFDLQEDKGGVGLAYVEQQ